MAPCYCRRPRCLSDPRTARRSCSRPLSSRQARSATTSRVDARALLTEASAAEAEVSRAAERAAVAGHTSWRVRGGVQQASDDLRERARRRYTPTPRQAPRSRSAHRTDDGIWACWCVSAARAGVGRGCEHRGERQERARLRGPRGHVAWLWMLCFWVMESWSRAGGNACALRHPGWHASLDSESDRFHALLGVEWQGSILRPRTSEHQANVTRAFMGDVATRRRDRHGLTTHTNKASHARETCVTERWIYYLRFTHRDACGCTRG